MELAAAEKSMAQVAVEGPITAPVLVRENQILWDDDGGSHRPKGREHKYFGFFDRDRGIALRADLELPRRHATRRGTSMTVSRSDILFAAR